MMSGSWRVRMALVAGAWVALWPTPIVAHDIPADRPISAFVKVGSDRLDLLLRIPLDTLLLPLPTTAERIDVDASVPLLDDSLTKVSEAVTLFEGMSPLLPAKREFRLSLPSDRSFDSYAAASARLEDTVSATAIYANQGYLDARLSYRLGSPASMISVQSRFTEAWGGAPRLSLTFVSGEGERRYVIHGGLGRVALNPTMSEAVRRFFVLGLTLILGTTEYLLLLICLIVPLRMFRDIAVVVGAAVSGYAAATVAAMFTLVRVDDPFAQVAGASTAVVVTAAAVFNLVAPSFSRRRVLATIGGVMCGFASAQALQTQLPFAGFHPLASAFALNMGTIVGQLLVVTALAEGALLLVHRSITAQLRILLVSAIVADLSWHWSIERVTPLWQAGWPYSGPSLLILARSIAAVVLVVSVAQYLLRAFHPHAPSPGIDSVSDSEPRAPENAGFAIRSPSHTVGSASTDL